MTPDSPSIAESPETPVQERPLEPLPKMRFVDSFRGVSRTLFSRPVAIGGAIGTVLGAFILSPTGSGPSMCTLQRATGLPCPGCGLTRSVTSFLHGHFSWAWHYHPFGPIIALFFVFLTILAVLPKRYREPIMQWLEKRDAVVAWIFMVVLIAMVAYGIIRLILVAMHYPPLAWWLTSGTQDPPFITSP
ncbi:DUF2752 domain-containing protein [bacterium]|nr:DUF2752 domain-containing protein [bacterium]